MTTVTARASEPAMAKNKSELIMGLAIIGLVIVALMSWVTWTIRVKNDEMRQQLSDRLELLAASRAEVISAWLNGLSQQTDRLISSDLFRLYATDMDLINADPSFLITGDIPAGSSHDQMMQLADQLPLMHQTFADFTAFAGFLSGRIVHRTGQSYVASDAHLAPLTPIQTALIKKTFAYPMVHFSPLRLTDNGLVIDLFAPIFSTAAPNGEKKAVAVVMMTKSATVNINNLLSNTPLSAKGERTRIMQLSDTTYQEVVPWTPSGLAQLGSPPELDSAQRLAFGLRDGLGGQGRVYSIGVKVPELDWWVIQEVAAPDAAKNLQDYARTAIFIAILIALVLCLLFGTFWWRTIGRSNGRIAAEFKALAHELERQRSFLDSINGSIPDFIAVKNLDGVYTYANPALADGVGRMEGDVLGLDDIALFGFDTGKRLEESDDEALKSTRPVTVTERIYLKSQLHHFQITKVVLKDDSLTPQGIVSVFRDVTTMVQAEERKRLTIQQTVVALVKAIEFIDPYLAGHSVMMREVASLLADSLNMSPEDKATVEIASHLSQIGKIFVDKNLLTKTDQLSDEELALVHKHVEHAGDILRQIDFELPVYEAVYQMNERLDGSGYPRGLDDGDISLQARVLSVANSFCAMIRPRAYRPAMTAENALKVLRETSGSYDQAIVAALSDALRGARGNRLLEKSHE